MSDFSEQLEMICKQSKMQQKDIAKALGISPATLNGWIKGTRKPNIPMIKALSELLNVSADRLINTIYSQSEANEKKSSSLKTLSCLTLMHKKRLLIFLML